MPQSNISFSIDNDLKENFNTVCGEMGLSMSAAFNVFVRAVTRRRGIPFEITAAEDPFYSEANQAYLRRAIADVEAGRNVSYHEIVEFDD
ncbi:DNA-damage-inducible protein J [Clostridia bacterium]|nr:DNA-damage-inducible protein J [Clostridia bacterium]